jgi:hypothetical protein
MTDGGALPARVRGVLLAAGAACFSLGLATIGARRANALRDSWPPEADLMYLPSAKTLRHLSLGHPELAADLVAARANVYYGSQLVARGQSRWLDQYLHTAMDLDPNFRRLYASGAAMLVYYGGQITTDMVEKANAVLVRGEKAVPDDWNIPFQLGFNLFFELPGTVAPDDPRIAHWRQEGADAFRRAALFEGVPNWLPNLTARLLTKQGGDELAIRHLEQAYAATSSEETRAQIAGKLEVLKNKRLVEQMEAGRKELEAALAAGYDYTPEAFSLIVGPRRGRSVEPPGQRSAPTASSPASSSPASSSPASASPPPSP